jgi:hypothetical protein
MDAMDDLHRYERMGMRLLICMLAVGVIAAAMWFFGWL